MVVFMISALNTEVGSLIRIEYLTLSTIQFYSSGSARTHYSRMPFRISPGHTASPTALPRSSPELAATPARVSCA